MIEHIEAMPEGTIGIRVSGDASREEYEQVVKPAIEEGLKQAPKLRMLVQYGPEPTSIESGAIWEDAKVGIRHPLAWERVAIVTDVDWIRRATNMFGFLMPGEVKVFSNVDLDQGKQWVAA